MQSCCPLSAPPSDASPSHLSTQHGEFCTLRAGCAIIRNLVGRWVHIHQSGTQGTTTQFDTTLYITTGQSPLNSLEPDPTVALWFTLPFGVKTLWVNLGTNGNGAGVVGDLSIQLADPSGMAFSGTVIPASIPEIMVNGTVAQHLLETAIPANTPFIICMQSTGDGTTNVRFNFLVQPC